MRFSAREDVISITPLNPFDRFDDGRPKVPDDLLERVKLVTGEEAWSVLRKHGYDYQFEGNWVNLHPDRIMVGRAVTATMVPIRPDLNDVVNAQGEREGRHGSQNNWVIQPVVEKDVVVRGFDPTPIRDVTLVSLNGPTRIGQATVLPGDVVLGTLEGVMFIPPHLVEEVITTSEEICIRDEFGKERLREQKYTSGQIDVTVWEDHIEADFQEWRKQRQS